ncbi:CIPK9-like protein [Mya arenaria]|uniref:non-specific serine/threonine protein kinase n=1 Tax=Mya arenaria TaxID=6604 RepID=A0ABY7EC63_MYAAR|nr:CIPK9-like protein [Mya arenaria]
MKEEDLKAELENVNIVRQKSELMAPRDARLVPNASLRARFREVTFDDCFRGQFEPLDGRKKVGEYVLGRLLGEGAFSKVRAAKRLNNTDTEEHARRRFLREMTTLRRLEHGNIVRLREVMETSSNFYLVMDLARGTSLKEHLACRDLKPENLILDRGHLTVIDFGLSGRVAPDAFLTTQCGSPAYAAPEVLARTPYTQAVDIGVIVYLMLTGYHPFSIPGQRAYRTQLHAAMARGFTLSPFLSLCTDCKDVLSRLLRVEPKDRISARELLLHSWLAAVKSPFPKS